MSEQKQTLSFITIKKEHFDDRHFTFKVIRPSNSLITSAKVTIKRTIYKTKKTDAKEGDRLFISIQNNSEDKVLIFNGTIRSVSDMGDQIHITAESRVVANEEFNETYKDSSLEKVIKVLVPKMIYEAVDKIYSQLICRGKKEESLRRLLSDKHYFMNLDNYLIVRDDLKGGVTFVIDNCIYHDSVKSDSIPIVPIPQLEINDVVKYMEKQFIVRAITYDYLSKAQMVLHVVKYIKETISSSQNQQDDSTSKPVAPLFKPSETQAENGETAQSLLSQLNTNTRTYLETLAEQVRIEMGDSFESIVITSVWRSRLSQKNILLGKLDKKINADGSKTKNMYEYYQNTGISSKYLKIIQYLYDGVYTEVPENDYLAINDKVKRDVFKKIVSEFGIRKKNREDVEKVLEESFMKKKLFNPSYHVSDTEKKDVRVIDLRTSKESELLQDKHNMERKAILTESEGKIDIGRAYNGGGIGDPHIHVTYRL